MSKSERIKILDAGIKEIVGPFLKERQFDYTPKTRTFRKTNPENECTWIIDFQVGQRFMEGRFTVNLAFFYPDLHSEIKQESPLAEPREYHCHPWNRERLGALRDTPITSFFKRFIKGSNHWFTQWLITSPDRWWKFSNNEPETRRSLKKVVKELKEHGLS